MSWFTQSKAFSKSKNIPPTTLLLFNPLNAELNPICHLLALLEGATIVVVSRLRVKAIKISLIHLQAALSVDDFFLKPN